MATRRDARTISHFSRRDMFDLMVGPWFWAGNLDEDAFLGRVFDLASLPSYDRRLEFSQDAAADIHQHRVNNNDWNDDYPFSDPRFNLGSCSDEVFLEFLVQALHPKIRHPDIAVQMTKRFNELLAPYSLELYAAPDSQTPLDSAHPQYHWRELGSRSATSNQIAATKRLTNKAVLNRELERIHSQITTNPADAISQSKNLLETLFKLIIEDQNRSYSKNDDVPALYRKAADAISAESVNGSVKASGSLRKALRTLTNIVQMVAEFRNELGDDHGGTVVSPAEPRHARLAYGAALTVAEYLVDTLEQKPPAKL